MKQLDFSALPATEANAQAQQRERVRRGIAPFILDWCRHRVNLNHPQFRMDELRAHIEGWGHRAPDSAGRILRLLRQEGAIKYSVVNRAQSLYRIEEVSE